MNQSDANQSTNWRAVWVLYLAGCTLSLHVGKLPAALPLLAQEYSMSLSQTGTLVSFYAVLVALGGVLCGALVARVGYGRFAGIGLGLCAVGSFAGIYASSVEWLMVTRAIEGLGWIMGVVAIPVLMSAFSSTKDHPVVLGMWGGFMAVGSVSMLLIAPGLHDYGGWRLSWKVAACLSGVGTLAACMVCYKARLRLSVLRTNVSTAAFADLKKRRSVALFVCFLCYSLVYVAVSSYLPSLLAEDPDMSLATATLWTAFILLPNAIGNVSAGWLINRGLKRSTIVMVSALALGVCALVTLSTTDTTVRIVAAVLTTGIGGVIPGVIFSTAGLLSTTAGGAGVIIGFVLSGAGVGQFLGPMMLARLVEWSGLWYVGGLMCLCVAIVGACFARLFADLPVVAKRD